MLRTLTLPLVVAAMLIAAPAAQALIEPVAPIDGPSAEIVELGGVAMAADGTGGLVYRKRVEGRAHIFVAQYVGGKWGAPQRVDTGENFESSFPAIAAGEGGRLVVVWANHYSSTTDGLFSASLEPGSTGFQPPVPVDLEIGQATGTYPSVAMNLSGQALVVYRVITAVSGPSTPEIPTGYVEAEVRMARFDGEYWSSFGQPINRNPAQPMLTPTAANSPKVAIDLTGQGLVAWQEPDNGFVNRIYARRIFGMVPGNILQVSPSTYEGHALNGPADELAIDVDGFGEGAVAYRQQPAPGSGFTRPRVFVSEIPSSFDPHGSVFAPARIVDGGGAEGPAGPVGALSMAVDAEGDFDVGFGSGVGSFDARGTETEVSSPVRLDESNSSVAGEPVLTRADNGAFAAAWKVEEHGAGAVAVLERRADGTPNRQLVSAPHGGAVHQLELGGSHHGDALIAFLQGDGANTQIAALAVRAPPGEFVLDTPAIWVNDTHIPLQWETPLAGAGNLTYSVLVDDREVAENLTNVETVLTPAEVPNGVHTIQVEATDSLGQVVDSEPSTLKVDRKPPVVRVHVHGSSVTVRVSDGPKGESSGVAAGTVHVSFGDKHSAHGRAKITHRYKAGGSYTITATALDNAGNHVSFHRRVSVS
ncbi:MAG TPA: PKD domain-containing protein [Solirubrobacteraceae bacterium]